MLPSSTTDFSNYLQKLHAWIYTGRHLGNPVDRPAFEGRQWPLKLRLRARSSALCEDSDDDHDGTRSRSYACLLKFAGLRGSRSRLCLSSRSMRPTIRVARTRCGLLVAVDRGSWGRNGLGTQSAGSPCAFGACTSSGQLPMKTCGLQSSSETICARAACTSNHLDPIINRTVRTTSTMRRRIYLVGPVS